jgi:phosphoribosylamine---glycine ligase
MRLLIVGNGAREHALAWAAQGKNGGAPGSRPNEVFCAPGNAGTAGIARNLPVDPLEAKEVLTACRELGIELVIVGPEQPLAAGLVDVLNQAGIPAFGPPRKSAALEASKAFARAFSERHGVPCASTSRFVSNKDLDAFRSFIRGNGDKRLVLKKSGLAAGKGVLESADPAELLAFGEAVLAADDLLAEDFLVGQELSVFALCTEGGYRLLEPAVDHKKALAGDNGPNTGGMGAVSPVPFADAGLMAEIEKKIMIPTFAGMEAEGLGYRGLLFFGLMVTASGPRLLEYNVRFGDPEAQSILPRLEGDFAGLCAEVAAGRLPSPRFSSRHACGVVVAAPGYPISHPRGLPVDLSELEPSAALGKPEVQLGSGPGDASSPALLFQSATGRDAEGGLRTGGGRCFTAVGLGPDWKSAHDRAYDLARRLHFQGAWYRPDIGNAVHRGGSGN